MKAQDRNGFEVKVGDRLVSASCNPNGLVGSAQAFRKLARVSSIPADGEAILIGYGGWSDRVPTAEYFLAVHPDDVPARGSALAAARLRELEADEQVVEVVAGRKVTRGELRRAFDRVANPDGWKLPIDTVGYFAECEIELVTRAVVFFTGSRPTFTLEQVTFTGRSLYTVKAQGYYAAVGA